jgi:hypothetical protein
MAGYPVPLGPVGYPLPAHAWPGGYPILYLTAKDQCLCADCANNPEAYLGPAVVCDVFWEGSPLECEECGGEIASAYGDPEITDERTAEDWKNHAE